MDSSPVVSVIMPAYNSERFIGDAIDSVAAQGLPLELIIIDDRSKDGTMRVVQERRDKYADKPISFVVLQNERNMGVAFSRNRGFAAASCELCALLDSDDVWRSDKLRKQLPLMKQGAPLCSTGREFIDENGHPRGEPMPVSERISYKRLLYHNCINCSSVIIRTAIAREFPMGHDDCHEDYLCWLSVVKKYGEARAINEPLLLYRRHSGSKTSGKLKSAAMHYKTLRLAGVSPPRAAFYFVSYAVSGVVKHFLRG